MKRITIIFFLTLFFFVNFKVQSQITERQRPAEWNNLVNGGRFMDRFLPMPIMGELTSDTWGADAVVPRYTENGLEDNINSYWGGNVKVDENGKFHLFVCGWPENSPKGHMYWPHSTIFHAVSVNSFGPYELVDSIGPGHNPETFQLSDGRYVIYVYKAYYISESLNGPWERKTFDFDPRDREIIEGLSNVTFAQREDGSYLAVCRGGGIWFSKTGISPYNQVTDKRVYPPVDGRFEDPVVWRTNIQYHLIVNDWLGRIAWYLRSKDGINWKVDPGEAYMPGVAKYEDGTVVDWFKYERIKVLQDKYGRATQAHFAVIDTIKWNDLENDNHSSKHIIIPLSVGRLITILNKKAITGDTKAIEVKIEAEEGFNPHTDINIESLRFGASEEVNFGRGSKVVGTKKSGNDLLVTFEGKGNGLTEDNFAAKLLGKTTNGKLLFGYSRLPEINYMESALSAKLPTIEPMGNGAKLKIEVQNFGQVISETSTIKVVSIENNKEIDIASGTIPKLESFEKTDLLLNSDIDFIKNKAIDIRVIINSKNQKPITLDGIVEPKLTSVKLPSFRGY